MLSKRCTGCGEVKGYSEFQKGKRYVGGVKSRCKACIKERSRIRYERDRERILIVAKAWKDKHPDKCKAYVRKRRAEHSDEVKAWQRDYSARYPEIYRMASRKWQRANPEQVKANIKARKARLKGAPIVDFTSDQWAALKQQYDFRCAYCGERKELTQDHVVPLSQGGAHTMTNIVPACGSCNSRKSARTPAQAEMSIM